MPNLQRRRSRSQTPNWRNQIREIDPEGNDFDSPKVRREILPPAAEMGVRVVNTQRPKTPKDHRRQLYGKVAPADRPPSAFSLKYLQLESRNPFQLTLEPLKRNVTNNKNENIKLASKSLITRSQSLDSFYQNNYVKSTGCNKLPKKLPALDTQGALVRKIDDELSKATLNGQIPDVKEILKKTTQETFLSTKGENFSTSKSLHWKHLSRRTHLLSQSTTEKLIDMLKEHAGLKDCTEETVQHINVILFELYQRVRYGDKNWKRGLVLGGLYGLVECSSAKILLAVAHVVLATNVTGSNLTGACKLIFKVARNEQNDYLFYENDILELLIDGLGRASPLDDPEACIYGYGSIRFLTSSTDQERSDTTNTKEFNKTCVNCYENYPRKPPTAPSATMRNRTDLTEIKQKICKQYNLVERLACHGCVELMILHLQMLNEAGMAKKLVGPPLHSLYQLSAALRALANLYQVATLSRMSSCHQKRKEDNKETEQLIFTKINFELACPHLIKAAEITIGEIEVQENIVRTLSVLSDDDNCCRVLANFSARIGMFLGSCCQLFNNTPEKLLSLINRLGYILGNIMAKYDTARVQFFHNDVAMQYLINVIEIYSKEQLTQHNHMDDTVIDVLVKITRVIANMSVNSEVGFGLIMIKSLGDLLLCLLNKTGQINYVTLPNDILELIKAILGAMHNLCFYQDKIANSLEHVDDSKGSFNSILNRLANTLYIIIWNSPEEIKIEATRVLGNLTRNKNARESFCRAGGLQAIVYCLTNESNAYELKTSAIGVLVNLLSDCENRIPFIKFKGGPLIVNLLKSTLEQKDWFISAITCQAVWNLLIDTTNVFEMFDDEIINEVGNLLAEYLEENRFPMESNTDGGSWNEFVMVSRDLLEQIKSIGGNINLPSLSSSDDNDGQNEDDDVSGLQID